MPSRIRTIPPSLTRDETLGSDENNPMPLSQSKMPTMKIPGISGFDLSEDQLLHK